MLWYRAHRLLQFFLPTFLQIIGLFRLPSDAANAMVGDSPSEGVSDARKLALAEELLNTRRHPSGSGDGKYILGYSACTDVSVHAVDFVRTVIAHFNLTDQVLRPIYHPVPDSVETFLESFAYFFGRGANAEQRLRAPAVFAELVRLAVEKVQPSKSYPGGNALTMANRIALEGADSVLLGAQLSGQRQSQLHPSLEIVRPLGERTDEDDVHLALEYQPGDSLVGIPLAGRAPRTNRFYLNADRHNSLLTAAESLHARLERQPDRDEYTFVVSGLQLMDPRGDGGEDGLAFLQTKLDQVSEAMRNHVGPTHFESGAFENDVVFSEVWTRGIVQSASSIGLNEQELALLDWKLHRGGVDMPMGTDSKPSIQETLKTLKRVLRTLHEGGVTRMHFHTLHFHALCYDPEIWEHGARAVGAGSAVSSLLSCGDALEKRQMDAFDLRHDRTSTTCDSTGSSMGAQPLRLTCCTAPVLVCRSPSRTAGLGDNISGTGLVYQRRKRNKRQFSTLDEL